MGIAAAAMASRVHAGPAGQVLAVQPTPEKELAPAGLLFWASASASAPPLSFDIAFAAHAVVEGHFRRGRVEKSSGFGSNVRLQDFAVGCVSF